MAFCKIMFIGNLGRDPEMRYTPNGRPVTQFSVAVSHSKPDGQGGWVDEGTDWFRVSVFGDRAERAAEQLRKGNRSSSRVASRPASSKARTARSGRRSTSSRTTSSASTASGRDDDGGPSPVPPSAGALGGAGGCSGRRSRPPADDTDLDDLPF